MRLWTLHPKYLDSRGLVTLWREALLAQAVLNGQTRGYIHHPQLHRFRATSSPLKAIGSYLQTVLSEATKRQYRFDAAKIVFTGSAKPIATTQGQLDYEWEHLQHKLRIRDLAWLAHFENITYIDPHPLFHIIPGTVEEWEVAYFRETQKETRKNRI